MPTFNSLNDLLKEIKGARICQLRTKTEVRANKKSRVDGTPFPFPKGVSKLAVRSVILGTDYSNVVNNQLAREEKVGDFVPEQLWKGRGRRISRLVCEHVDTKEQYLAVLPKTDADNFNVTKSVYINNETGCEIDPDLLKDFLPEYKEIESQGTDKVVHWQVVKLSNILGIKSGELEYTR